jgi:hypothetical protein
MKKKKEEHKIYIQNPSQSPFSKGRNDYYGRFLSLKRMETILRLTRYSITFEKRCILPPWKGGIKGDLPRLFSLFPCPFLT